MIDQVDQFAYLIALSLFCLGHVGVQGQYEVLDQTPHSELALVDLRVDLGA